MAAILSVEQGDRFESHRTETTIEVVKVWFEFSLVDNRWETSVIWDKKYPQDSGKANDSVEVIQLSGKARDFVKILQDCSYVRVDKVEDISFSATTAQVSPPGPNGPYVSSVVDPKSMQWEHDFRKNAARYGLSPSDLGRKIFLGRNRSRNYTIIGAKPRNWKMPILVKGRRGGIYKITAEKAKAGLV